MFSNFDFVNFFSSCWMGTSRDIHRTVWARYWHICLFNVKPHVMNFVFNKFSNNSLENKRHLHSMPGKNNNIIWISSSLEVFHYRIVDHEGNGHIQTHTAQSWHGTFVESWQSFSFVYFAYAVQSSSVILGIFSLDEKISKILIGWNIQVV